MHGGKAVGLLLHDFWFWAYSDLIDNVHRGALAEFIVAAALGVDLAIPQSSWDRCDIIYRGTGIQVKSAAYHQRWFQKKESPINFVVAPRRGWDAQTNLQDDTCLRHALAYILCLLAERDRSRLNPLDLDQWRFWVVPTAFFNSRVRSQHSITYNSLVREVGAPIGFSEIKAAADKVLDELETSTVEKV